jgi:hypothetical protein
MSGGPTSFHLQRIFAVVPDAHTSRGHYGQLWRRNIYEGLALFVQSLITPSDLNYDWARQVPAAEATNLEAERRHTNDLLWQQIQSAHRQSGLDAVLSYCFGGDVSPEVVRATQKLDVPWINFFCDSTHRFEEVEPLARLVSLNWFPEQAALPRYQALGVPCLCAPYAFSPDSLPDLTNRSIGRTVAFIGLPSANRITQLGWLNLRGCSAEIRGHGWIGEERTPFYSPTPASRRFLQVFFKPNLGEKILRRLFWPKVRRMARGPLSDQEFPDYVRGTLIVLGLNQAKDAQGRLASYLKFRDVEFPGYGCCYLTEHHEDIPRVFEVGREIVTFRTIGEAVGHIRRLSRQPELAREIGLAGRRRVLAEHNWGARLRQFEQALGKNPRGSLV